MTITPIAPVSTPVAFDAAELKATLTRLRPLIGKAGSPVLRSIHVAFDGEHATLTATDLDNALRIRLTAPSLGEGSFLVPFDRLAKVTGAHGKGTITLEAAGDFTHIRFARSTVSVEAPPADEFPKFPPIEGREVALNLDCLADVLPAVSTDEYRPILCSVLVEDGRYVATDSYRLYVAESPDSTGGSFLLNREAVKLAVRYHDGVRQAIVGERNVQVDLDENTTLIARLVDGSFPPYRSLIPETDNVIVEFGPTFPTDLKQLTKLGISDPASPVRVLPGDSDGEVIVQIGSGGSDTAKTVCEGMTKLDSIGWNPQYLLALVDGMANLTFYGVDSLKPSCLWDHAPGLANVVSRMRLLMPVRMS